MNRSSSLRPSILLLLLAGALLLATAASAQGDGKNSGDDASDSPDDGGNDVAGGDGGGEDDAGGGADANPRAEAPPKTEASTIPLDAAALETESETSTKPAIETSTEPVTTAIEPSPPPPTPFDLPQYRLTTNGGETCILVEMDALVEVLYDSKTKEKRKAVSYVGEMPEPKGSCGDDEASLTIEWKEFKLRWSFMKTLGGERWYVKLVELQYDKSELIFENASSVGETTLSTRRAHGTMLFPTPVGKSFHCQSEYTLNLSPENGRSTDTATLLLRQFRMQPFMYKSNFGPAFECNPGGVPKMRDETAPIAVGSTLAVVVLLTVTGYGVYRYFKIKKRFLQWVRSGPLHTPRGSQAVQQLDA